jgi:hypothetical protein
LDSALEDINKTIDKLESTMVKAETVFGLEQRKIYKRLLNQNCSPSGKVFTSGFIYFISNILKGKSTSEARRYLRQETQDKENGSLEDEIQKGFSLIDSLPFGYLKHYYYTVLEQGLKEANLIWMKRETQSFGQAFKSTPLRVEK